MGNQYGVGIIGTGKYIPKKIVTNEDICNWTGVDIAAILEKTGIESRFIAEDGEEASQMAANAAMEALDSAGISSEELGLILGCTFSGDYLYPAMACKVQAILEAWNAGAYDILANCTGFQVGLASAADKMFFDPTIKYSLVMGAALQSRYVNWEDPNTAMYCGDGVGAAILGQVPEGYGILSNEVLSNGRVYEAVRIRGGGSSFIMNSKNVEDNCQYFEMNGMEVWKQVVQWQPKIIRKSLEKIGLTIEDVDHFIFHQANLRLIEYLMAKMKIPMTKTTITAVEYGNTADASLALTLDKAVKSGRLKRGDIVVVSGVGAGFIYGATVMKWF